MIVPCSQCRPADFPSPPFLCNLPLGQSATHDDWVSALCCLKRPWGDCIVSKPGILRVEGGAPRGGQSSGHKSGQPERGVSLFIGYCRAGDMSHSFPFPQASIPRLPSTSAGGLGCAEAGACLFFRGHCPLEWLARKCVSLALNIHRRGPLLLGESRQQSKMTQPRSSLLQG